MDLQDGLQGDLQDGQQVDLQGIPRGGPQDQPLNACMAYTQSINLSILKNKTILVQSIKIFEEYQHNTSTFT